jgi:hypothetical protein
MSTTLRKCLVAVGAVSVPFATMVCSTTITAGLMIGLPADDPIMVTCIVFLILAILCKLRFFTKKKLLEVRFEYDGSLVTEDQKWNITYGMSRALRAAGFTTARISTSYPTLISIRLRQSATAPSDASAGP